MDTDRFFVLTGGPGSGKSTLADELERNGFARSMEAGRGVIRDQVAIGGRGVPWIDPAYFAELMLSWDTRSHRMASRAGDPVFFDRGVPDVIGYLRLTGQPVPAHVEEAARRFRYNGLVFIAPPWREIFTQDAERKQDFAEAERTSDSMRMVYAELGYSLVELPLAPVKDRLRFVLEQVTARLQG